LPATLFSRLAALSIGVVLLALPACSQLPTNPGLAAPAGAELNGGSLGNGTRDGESIPGVETIVVTTGESCG